MKNTYSVTEGQAAFPSLVRQSRDSIVSIERHGKVEAFIVGRDRMEAIAETLELMGSADFRKTLAAYRAGKLRMKALR